jgi:uncharacterized membrane protein YbhN (UPF0104 family)
VTAPLALGDSFRSFFEAIDKFVSSLAAVHWGPLLIALAAFFVYLSLRARASFNILRAAYPDRDFKFLPIWGAYWAGYGFNNVIPARGGDVIRIFLTKTSIPESSYSAVAAAFAVEFGYDLSIGVVVLTFAFTQGVFPKPPDFSKLNAFDLSYFASHPEFALFTITFLAIAVIALTALMSARVKAFWSRVRQGLTIIFDRRRYFRQVWLIQFCGWLFRFTAFWFLLEAFNIGGSVRNVMLVLGVNAVAAVVPFTPGGAGVQQALLAKVFASTAAADVVVAYSVGQQVAIAAFTFAIGFGALAFVFKIRSFKEVIRRGKEDRAADKERAGVQPATG